MSLTYTYEEFQAMARACRKELYNYQLKFSKTSKPRRPGKALMVTEMHINTLIRKMPRLCNDGLYRYPQDIERLESEGIKDVSNFSKLPQHVSLAEEDFPRWAEIFEKINDKSEELSK